MSKRIRTPKLVLPKNAEHKLMRVIEPGDNTSKLIRLHLYTEFLLNEALAAFLRTDHSGIQSLNLRYPQKVRLLVVSGILDSGCAESLSSLNSVRNKVAHHFDYQITTEDEEFLLKFIHSAVPKIRGVSAIHRIAAFFTGYLGGCINLAQMVGEAAGKKIPTTK